MTTNSAGTKRPRLIARWAISPWRTCRRRNAITRAAPWRVPRISRPLQRENCPKVQPIGNAPMIYCPWRNRRPKQRGRPLPGDIMTETMEIGCLGRSRRRGLRGRRAVQRRQARHRSRRRCRYARLSDGAPRHPCRHAEQIAAPAGSRRRQMRNRRTSTRSD